MLTHTVRSRRTRLLVALLGVYLWRAAAGLPGPAKSPEEQLHALWNRVEDQQAYAGGIAGLEAFAQQHAAHPDVAAQAHLHIIECLVRTKDLDRAVAKAKWLGETLPKARAPRYYPFGSACRTMYDEWLDYVGNHPIYIRDYAWLKIGGLHERAEQFDEALAAYDHILATVPPEPVPDTKNMAVLHTLRLHKDTLQAKVKLLMFIDRYEQAKQVMRTQEKLYPRAAWRKVAVAATRAFSTYEKESAELGARERAVERKRAQEVHDKARKQREAEEEERRRREEAMRARDEERTQKYLKHKRESSSREKPAEPTTDDPPPAPEPQRPRPTIPHRPPNPNGPQKSRRTTPAPPSPRACPRPRRSKPPPLWPQPRSPRPRPPGRRRGLAPCPRALLPPSPRQSS